MSGRRLDRATLSRAPYEALARLARFVDVPVCEGPPTTARHVALVEALVRKVDALEGSWPPRHVERAW
jgi:hypothetical protein